MSENQYISIGQAAKLLGVAVVTLRRWEKLGKLIAKYRTFGSHRRYDFYDVMKIFEEQLAKDVLEIITVFSAKLYGSRSNKNKKLANI